METVLGLVCFANWACLLEVIMVNFANISLEMFIVKEMIDVFTMLIMEYQLH